MTIDIKYCYFCIFIFENKLYSNVLLQNIYAVTGTSVLYSGNQPLSNDTTIICYYNKHLYLPNHLFSPTVTAMNSLINILFYFLSNNNKKNHKSKID